METKVEFEKTPTEGNENKKWCDMTFSQKLMYVLKALVAILIPTLAAVAGWKARGYRDRGIADKARRYDELQRSNNAPHKSGQQQQQGSGQGYQQRPQGPQMTPKNNTFAPQQNNSSRNDLL